MLSMLCCSLSKMQCRLRDLVIGALAVEKNMLLHYTTYYIYVQYTVSYGMERNTTIRLFDDDIKNEKLVFRWSIFDFVFAVF